MQSVLNKFHAIPGIIGGLLAEGDGSFGALISTSF